MMDDPDSPEFILPEYNIEDKPVNLSYPMKIKEKKLTAIPELTPIHRCPCGRSFKQEYSFTYHQKHTCKLNQKTTAVNNGITFSYDDTSTTVSNDDEAISFEKKFHPENSDTHRCPHCSYSTGREHLLRDHINEVHKGLKPHKIRKDGSHQCQECDYSTQREKVLRDHINQVHRGIKPHKCPHCDYAAGQMCTLRVHIRSIHEKIKPYKCTECVRAYHNPSQLQYHVNAVHNKLKPHKCTMCDVACTTRSGLKNHVNAIHKKIRTYKCEICVDYSAATLAGLKAHMAAVHKEGKYKCERCDFVTYAMGFLDKHIAMVHRKEKPFKCPEPECGYGATSKLCVKVHVQNFHSGPIVGKPRKPRTPKETKEIKCKRCEYTTFSRDFLRGHMQKMHPKTTKTELSSFHVV